MKGKGAAVGFAVMAAALALVAACVDLFHSTDFQNICDLDARAPGCPGLADASAQDAGDAADAAGTDFCAWTPKEALTHAQHACGWLGACTAPFEQNAFGACMVDAILAYDCLANPNATIAPGPLHEYWDALRRAESCAEVNAAVFPNSTECSGAGYGCAGTSAVVECDGDGKKGAPGSCMVEGQVCKGHGVCEPLGALSCGDASASGPTCEGTVLHDCEGSVDLGYDCQFFGAGNCLDVDAGSACEPATANGTAGPCSITREVTCSDSVATSCPTGTSISIDCARLTGALTCKPGLPSPVWNLAAACQGKAACAPGCAGDTLKGCAQGAEFTTSCKGLGLGACRSVKLPASKVGYACTPP